MKSKDYDRYGGLYYVGGFLGISALLNQNFWHSVALAVIGLICIAIEEFKPRPEGD